MRHIRDVDGEAHTVLMMQVENEVGVLGDSRDRSPAANRAFNGQVPKELMTYLQQHRDTLIPEFRRVWEAAGSKPSGAWEEVFGPGAETDKIFMAWNYGRYVQYVAAAGKAQFPLPMYVNTWLGGPPSLTRSLSQRGPLPEVMDLWKAAGTAIDIYAPDIYAPNFAEWCDRYSRAGNPLFIPEAYGGATRRISKFFTPSASVKPFVLLPSELIPSSTRKRNVLMDANNDLGKSYEVLLNLAPTILQHEGREEMAGFLLDKDHPKTTVELKGYPLDVSLDHGFETDAKTGYGLIIAVGPDEFLGAGDRVLCFFQSRGRRIRHTWG